eukprot:125654-Prorocentrum_minimum.AAC.1
MSLRLVRSEDRREALLGCVLADPGQLQSGAFPFGGRRVAPAEGEDGGWARRGGLEHLEGGGPFRL